MKEEVLIAAKIYRCQESAMKLFREEYPEKVKWYVDTLRDVMEKEELSELKAVLFVSKLDSVKDNGVAIMMFIAAVAEIIEGRPKRTGQHTNTIINQDSNQSLINKLLQQ